MVPSLESNVKMLTGQMTQCQNVIGNFKLENNTLKEQLHIIEGKYSQSTDELVTAIEKCNQLGQYRVMYEELVSNTKDKPMKAATPAATIAENSVLKEAHSIQIVELQEEINRLKDENSKLTQSIQQKTREVTASLQVKDELEALLSRRDATASSIVMPEENAKITGLMKEIVVLTEAISVLQNKNLLLEKQKLTKSSSTVTGVSDRSTDRGSVEDNTEHESLASVVNVLNQSKSHWQKLATSAFTRSLLPLPTATIDSTTSYEAIYTAKVYHDVRNVRARIKVIDLNSENINTIIQRNKHNDRGSYLLISI